MKRLCATVLMLCGLAHPAIAGESRDEPGGGAEPCPAGRSQGAGCAGLGFRHSGALERNGIRVSRSNVCSVMAVIGQELGFTANPEVKGLGPMAEKEIKAKLSRLPLVNVAATEGVNWFLANKPTPERSYLKLIRAARTERDLDLVFRNMAFFMFRQFASTRLLNTPALARRVDAINPVSTLGSMQVSIGYTIAEVEKARDRRLPMAAIWKLRDELYTREGRRQLRHAHAAGLSRQLSLAHFRFRGLQRRAICQPQCRLPAHGERTLGQGTGARRRPLGLFRRTAAAEPSATERALRRLKLGLDDSAIRADLLRGKDYDFRDTATYARVSDSYERRTGKQAPYAMIPQIKLSSPKIRHRMTTELFASSVMGRYEKCMKAR